MRDEIKAVLREVLKTEDIKSIDLQKTLLELTLERHDFNKSHACKALGMSIRGIRRKIIRLGIVTPIMERRNGKKTKDIQSH